MLLRTARRTIPYPTAVRFNALYKRSLVEFSTESGGRDKNKIYLYPWGLNNGELENKIIEEKLANSTPKVKSTLMNYFSYLEGPDYFKDLDDEQFQNAFIREFTMTGLTGYPAEEFENGAAEAYLALADAFVKPEINLCDSPLVTKEVFFLFLVVDLIER
jgi:hypothetical protein